MIAIAIRGICGAVVVTLLSAAGPGCASSRPKDLTKGPAVIQLEKLRDLDLEPSPDGRAFLSAASDVVLDGDLAYVVADDELILGIFEWKSRRPGRGLKLFPGDLPEQPAARKSKKPDLEACVLLSEVGHVPSLLMIPSGSTSDRNRGARAEIPRASGEIGSPSVVDFSAAFTRLSESISGLNIEGAAATESELILLHRGNDKSSRNAVIRLDRSRALAEVKKGKLSAAAIRSVNAIDLGEHSGTRLSFTSATFDSRGRLWFLAVAEGGGSNYHDGEFTGAVLGRLAHDLATVEASYSLAVAAKPEGLAFDPVDPARFYVVTDSDDPKSRAGLYSGRLE